MEFKKECITFIEDAIRKEECTFFWDGDCTYFLCKCTDAFQSPASDLASQPE